MGGGASYGDERCEDLANEQATTTAPRLAVAVAVRLNQDVLIAMRVWFFGGWGFVVLYPALVAAFTALALRQRSLTLKRANRIDLGELDQYDVAMLESGNGDVLAVRLAVVNLLHRGVLYPGPAPGGPGPRFHGFYFETREELPGSAHPLERAICDAVGGGTGRESAGRLLNHLARCDAIKSMRARLVDAGLLYGKQRVPPGLAPFVLLTLPYIAFLAFCFSQPIGEVTIGWAEALANGVAVLFGPLLALVVPLTEGPTPLAVAAHALGDRRTTADLADVQPQHRDAARALVHAHEKELSTC